MNFMGTVYCGDKPVAWDVLGICSGTKGNLTGVLVLSVGQDLTIGGCYTLLTDGGQVQNIAVLHSVGEPHQAKLVEFAATKAIRAIADRVSDTIASPPQVL